MAVFEDIKDIVDIDFLQNMQDFFASTMDVASLIVDDNGPVTKPSNFTNFCTHCIRSTDAGRKRCTACDIHWGKLSAEKKQPVVYDCHAGLTDFAVPIIIDNKHIASLLGGQVLTEALDESKIIKVANELNIDEKFCIEKAKEIKIIDKEKLNATVDFLYHVANAITEVFYANLKLNKIGMSFTQNKQSSIENWFRISAENPLLKLTPRELDVIKLIVKGKSNNEIAKELFISVHTVKAHVSTILEKFNVADRVQLAVKAIQEGLV